MIRIFKLVFLLVLSQVTFAQVPSNYININGRYRWIAGMFDSTFHIPKGSTPSLRTGGSTNAGALFYKTGDSSLYIYTGTQWLKIAGAAGFVPYVGATQDVDLDTWSLNAKSLHIKGNSGQGHLGLKFQSATPNMSANESGVYADASGNFGIKIDNLYTSIFKTSLNSADRTYTFQNKSYTVGDSADIAARVKYTDTASMLSPYYRLAGVGLKNTGQTVYADTLLLSTRAWRQKGVDSVIAVAANKYVPYTGATTSLDMGLFNISGQNITSNNYATGAAMSSISRSDVTASAYGILLLKRGVWGTLQPNPLTASDKNWYLPDTSGTLALRSELTGGTVTSVATNNGTGITGGTITTSGTLAIDTVLISTRKWRQKGVDSLQANINLKLNISDTASMLSPYLRSNVASATYVPQTRTITINGTSQDLSANRTYNVGTVTSVATNTGTGITGGTITSSGTIAADTLLLSTRAWRQKGIDSVAALANTKVSSVSGTSPIASSGGTSPTISISQSSASTNGFLSSTDWNTFNNKQNALTLTTTGTSGAATLVGSTLNIPQYQSVLTNPVTGTGTTNYIPKFTSSSAIGNSQIFDNGTNVGIGTATPDFKLSVVSTGDGASISTSTASVATRIRNTGNNDVILRITNNNNNFYDIQNNYSDNSFTIDYNDAERLRLTSGGSLGIGTSAPLALLDVASSTTNYPRFRSTGASEVLAYFQNSNTGTTVGDGLAIGISNTGVGAMINWENQPLYFATNGSERMRLDASGNLGLGTSSPSYKLDVTGTARTTSNLLAERVQVGTAASINDATGVGNTLQFANYSAGAFVSGSADAYIYKTSTAFSNLSAQTLIFQTRSDVTGGGFAFVGGSSPTVQLHLNSSGNLGLGVTPSATAGGKSINIGAQGYAFSDGVSYQYNSGFANNAYVNGNGTYAAIVSRAAGILEINESSFIWKQAGSGTAGSTLSLTSAMTLFSTGNLAVGGTSDGGKRLQVTGAANISQYLLIDNSQTFLGDNGNIGGGSADGNSLLQWYTGKDLYFKESGTARVTFKSGGNVGIGTTSPDQKLTIQAQGTSNGLVSFKSAAGTTTSFIGVPNANGDVISSSTTADFCFRNETGNMLFQTNGSERMRITSGGNVGIGTTSPSEKLEVNGAIKTAAPSGGTAKPYKWGEAGVAIGGSNGYAVKVEIDGTLYYLMTGYLPEPEPEPSAGPSMGYKAKFEEPVMKITTDNKRIAELEKQIQELKQLIKNK